MKLKCRLPLTGCIQFLIFFLVLFLSVSSTAENRFILNADETEAKKRMELPTRSRAAFVFGFLAGLDHLYNSTGLIVTMKRPLSAEELADELYKSLLSQPELRNGPIDQIILHALDDIIVISTKSGAHVSPGMMEVCVGC